FEARDRRRAVVTILPPAGLPEGRNALDANRLADADGGAFEARVRSRRADPVVARIFVSAGLAGVIILAGAIAIFLLVGSGRRSVDFLIVTDGEMKKVNWPTRPEVVGSTQVVIFASVLLAAILFMVDVGFSKFFQFVGVLEGG
ncbi:MAG: preprotein translocase subunit SecE, partial [Planctomycetota bacterium]